MSPLPICTQKINRLWVVFFFKKNPIHTAEVSTSWSATFLFLLAEAMMQTDFCNKKIRNSGVAVMKRETVIGRKK